MNNFFHNKENINPTTGIISLNNKGKKEDFIIKKRIPLEDITQKMLLSNSNISSSDTDQIKNFLYFNKDNKKNIKQTQQKNSNYPILKLLR